MSQIINARFYKAIFLSLTILSVFIFVYFVFIYISPNIDTIKRDIVENNNAVVNGNVIHKKSNNLTCVLKLSNKLLGKYKFYSVKINGQSVYLNDVNSKYYYTVDNGILEIKSKYILKPSTNKLTLEFFNVKHDFELHLIYSTDTSADLNNPDYWFSKPPDWLKHKNNLAHLTKTGDSSVNSISFRRKFESSVTIATNIIPRGQPINYAIRIGQGTSIFFGINDDKTIQIIQAKYKDKIKRNLIVKQFGYKFESGKPYVISVSKTKNKYDITISAEDGSSNKAYDYLDNSVEQNIKENFLNVGVDLWPGSDGVLLKNITIQSEETL